jgi:hypothetical protein
MNCSEIKHDLYSYFLTNSFLEIFQENTKAIKLTIMPENAPKIRSSRKTQVRTNATSDGTVIIIAIMVPLSIISDIVSLVDFSLSDNS